MNNESDEDINRPIIIDGDKPPNADTIKNTGKVINTDNIRTGDITLFCGNSPTNFILSTFTSSQWSHAAVAVRFIGDKISLTNEGDLYILETNTGERYDEIFKVNVAGVGFSRFDWAIKKYNIMAIRKLREIFRNEELADLTMQFANKYKGMKFPGTTIPFIAVWLGISLDDKIKGSEMFCSELLAHYYSFTIGPQYEKITGLKYDKKITTLFGKNSPYSHELMTPGHYVSKHTPNSCIFSPEENVIYTEDADLIYILCQPTVIILFIIVLIYMSLN